MDQSTVYRVIGERIKKRRVELNVTQAQLAEGVGVSRVSITNIESGKQNFPVHLVYEIAEYLVVSPFSLLPTSDDLADKPSDTLELIEVLTDEDRQAIRQAVKELRNANS